MSVAPARPNAAGDAALVMAIPATSPQDEATQDLVDRVREDVVPQVRAATGLDVHVGGATAAIVDQSEYTLARLPLFIGAVVSLSFLLLLVAFRSLPVAIKAGVMNLLSIGAAYGVVALVADGGWAGQLVGIDTPTPMPPFIPVMMFAIVFGLSMDYEVFLLSRIREEFLRHGDNARAVADGLAKTARVITAAAAIMIAVFSSFALSADVILKLMGIGMATAILIDATIVRMVLVPAIMQILGRANWWLPRWMEGVLPRPLPPVVAADGGPRLSYDQSSKPSMSATDSIRACAPSSVCVSSSPPRRSSSCAACRCASVTRSAPSAVSSAATSAARRSSSRMNAGLVPSSSSISGASSRSVEAEALAVELDEPAAAVGVGQRQLDGLVDAAGTRGERRLEQVGAVGRQDEQDVVVLGQAVHRVEQLEEDRVRRRGACAPSRRGRRPRARPSRAQRRREVDRGADGRRGSGR